jgi:hypothetical protein
MSTRQKLGDRGGVKEWEALRTIGDARRLLRWTILSVRNRTMSTTEASCLGQLSCHLIRAVELGDIEKRLDSLESTDRREGDSCPAWL